MEKTSANLQSSLVQLLLRLKTEGAQAPNQSAAPSLAHSASQSQLHNQLHLNLPPALRQLLTQHGQVQQLLPQIQRLHQALPTNSPSDSLSAQLLSRLLPGLVQQLSRSADAMTTAQLRSFVSQWFNTNPARGLTSPVTASLQTASQTPLQTTAQGTATPLLSAGILQWLVLQRSSHEGLAQLLHQQLAMLQQRGTGNTPSGTAAPAQAIPAGQLTNALLTSFANTLQGSLQDIRLSQIHLADTSAALQPEYYLVIPYQIGDKPLELEWLLRKEARKVAQQTLEVWHFTLRLTTQRFGPLLVKGSYQLDDSAQSSSGGLSMLRFYLSDEKRHQREAFESTLTHLQQRLQSAGLNQVEQEVHVGLIPATLAPGTDQLVRNKYDR